MPFATGVSSTGFKLANITPDQKKITNRSSNQRCSIIKGALRNIAKFTREHLFPENTYHLFLRIPFYRTPLVPSSEQIHVSIDRYNTAQK